MKKLIISAFILFILSLATITMWPKKENTTLKKVRVAEVAHSIFYAPQYVALEKGYFKEEGLDVELILTPGADKVSAAVLSGDVEIGFCGSEATIYVYNGGERDYLKTFAGLTKRDGTFLISRKKYEDFKLTDLKGKSIIGGRKGGMPEMTLEWALKQNGIDPKKDVKIDTSIAFAAMQGAFLGGIGDFVTLFEPNALQVEKQGSGYVVAFIGELGGAVPYTSYNAKKSYIDKNPEIINGFSKAIQKALDYVHKNSSENIAKNILKYFPDIKLDDMTMMIERYKSADSWYSTTYVSEKDFNHIQEIMISANELNKMVPYKDLVSTKYAKNK